MFATSISLGFFYQEHLENYERALQDLSLSRHTRRNYRTQVRQFLLFAQSRGYDGELLMSDAAVRDEAIERYRENLKIAMNTRTGSINTVLSTIRNFYRVNGRQIPRAERERAEKVEKTFLRADEVARLIGVLREPGWSKDRAVVTLFICCGMRLHECMSLNLEHVERTPSGFRINVTTGNEPRIIELIGEIAEFLEPWWQERNASIFHASDALFINRRGERISPSGFDAIVRRTGLRASLVLSARVLRNTWREGQ